MVVVPRGPRDKIKESKTGVMQVCVLMKSGAFLIK